MAAEETTAVVMPGSGMMSAMMNAECDIQIATAHRYPRVYERFVEKVRRAVTLNPDVAASMSYAKPGKDENGNDTKHIGPSVRFAEVIAPAYGNLRVAARPVEIDEYYVTAQGMCWDLETNLAQCRERKASIRKSNGQKYGASLIANVTNAAVSIAYRESVLKTIPKADWYDLWLHAQNHVVGAQNENLQASIAQALAVFEKRGITVDQVLRYLNRGAVSEIDRENVLALHAVIQDVKAKKTTFAEVFADPAVTPAEGDTSAKADAILREMERKRAGGAEAELVKDPPVT